MISAASRKGGGVFVCAAFGLWPNSPFAPNMPQHPPLSAGPTSPPQGGRSSRGQLSETMTSWNSAMSKPMRQAMALQLISPLVGEMPDRAEGGEAPETSLPANTQAPKQKKAAVLPDSGLHLHTKPRAYFPARTPSSRCGSALTPSLLSSGGSRPSGRSW